ncbi:nephrin-like [Homalodisca vitripennis]|uniref:nephrin-like n=1 Tax=Homalodisca vitripennis TaxID=197043 RepID=UPI001EEC3F41|nr:nephrin-like [Homalodisca vitripennis]
MSEKQPAELGVDHIREEDQAIYRCRVDFKSAQTRNSKINLTVIVPPSKMAIFDESHIERTSVVGPYTEGSDLILTCEVHGGRPPPHVLWYRGDEIITNRTTVSPKGGAVRNQVVLVDLGREDLHSELTCRAWNNNKTLPLSSTVHVDMNFRPLDVHILVSSQPLSAGRRYDLLCQSSGSRPQAKVTWWKGGKRLESIKETTSNDGNTTTSTLSFTVTKEDSGKNLTCRAENPTVSSEILETTWTLHVHYTPETKLTLGTSLNKENIREGTDVYFDCMVVAEPPVYKVEWRHNGKILYHNVNHGIIISNQSLVLQGVSRASAGNYTCVGFNTEGDGESDPFYLNVLYAPTCRPNQPRVHGVAKKERANITCEVDANPKDVNFKWTFNSSAESLDVESRYIVRSGTSSVVIYTPVSEHDYGTLLCWASNRIGHQRSPCVFHIIAAGRPDQVHNCTVANTSMTSFSVRCSEGFNGGLPQSFTVEVRETESQTLRANTTSPVPRFSVGGLDPGMQYQACVYSFNVKGRSEPVVVQTATLRLPEKQLTNEQNRPRGEFRFTPIMSVVTGVVSALFIVACVVAAVLRLQCSRNEGRRKRHKLDQRTRSASGSLCATSDKPVSPSKLDPSADSGGDSDEKNPDVIPQPVGGLESDEAQLDFLRKRQHISTIETRNSPSRSLLQHGPAGPFPGYCTLRNGGLPLHDLSNIPTKHVQGSVDSLYAGAGTLPRPHWSGPGYRHPAVMAYPRAPSHEEEGATSAPESPLMVTKRESTV